MFAHSKKMDEKICETPITGNYVAEHMKKSLGPQAILRSIKDAKRIAVGQGFVSHILRLELEWEKEENGLPKSVVVKVPVVESLHKLMETMASGQGGTEQMRAAMAQIVTEVHKCECELYHLLGKNPPVKMPKFFVALPVTEDAPGMIILEDLSTKGAIAPSFVDGLTYPQILAAVTEIARLHAWSLTTTADWRSKIPTIKSREPMMRQFLAPMVAGFKVTKEKYPEEFGSLDLEKLAPFGTYETLEKITCEHLEFMEDVLIHGDFHMNNMMFEKKSDGTVGDKLIALIDFQAVMQGSPAYDLGRLLTFSVSTKVRREHTDDILRRYYDEVKSIAGDKFKATFDQLRRIYEKNFAITAISMLASIPTLHHVMVRSEGEQKIKDERTILMKVKEDGDDAWKILGL